MGDGGRAGAAGQNEFLEHRQVVVELVGQFFEAGNLGILHDVHAGQAEFAAQIEQVVLDIEQGGTHAGRNVLAEQQADIRVEFINLADRIDAQAVLGCPAAIAEAGGAGIAGAGDDLREAVALALVCRRRSGFRSQCFSFNRPDYTDCPVQQTVALMPKFAANLSFLFTDLPFHERFQRAAAAGFRASSIFFPTTVRPMTWPKWLQAADVEQVLFNLPPGDWAAGERGLACLPHRQAEFVEGVELALDYAMVLDCERVHCMPG